MLIDQHMTATPSNNAVVIYVYRVNDAYRIHIDGHLTKEEHDLILDQLKKVHNIQ